MSEEKVEQPKVAREVNSVTGAVDRIEAQRLVDLSKQPKVGELPPLDVTDPESIEAEIEWKKIPQHLAQAKLYSAIGHRICRERQLLAEQQVSAGLREDLEQLRSLAKTREVCGHSTSWQCAGEGGFYCLMCRAEAAEASLAEARVGTSHLYVPKAQYEAAKARSERLQKLLDAYNSSGFADADAAMEKYLDAINELATLKAQEAPEKAWERAWKATREQVALLINLHPKQREILRDTEYFSPLPYTPPPAKEGQ